MATMVKIHIAMVGKDPDNIINGVSKQGGDELYPIISKGFEDTTIPEIKANLKSVRIHSRIFQRSLVVDPFQEDSFANIVGLIIEIVQARQKENPKISINITGGTNLMAAAGITACMSTGVEGYYVIQDPRKQQYKSKIVKVSLMLDGMKILSNRDRVRILHLLTDEEEWTNKEIAIELKISTRSISKHIKALEGKGFVSSLKIGRKRLNKLTDSGRIAGIMLH